MEDAKPLESKTKGATKGSTGLRSPSLDKRRGAAGHSDNDRSQPDSLRSASNIPDRVAVRAHARAELPARRDFYGLGTRLDSQGGLRQIDSYKQFVIELRMPRLLALLPPPSPPCLRVAGLPATPSGAEHASIRRFGGWMLSVRRCAQRVHAEQAVGPGLKGRPAAATGQRPERIDGIFVAVLGVDGFAGAEVDGLVADAHFLPPHAGEVHLNAVTFAVVEGVVLEGGQIEICPQLAVDAGEQIEIEFRGNTLGVVVGAVENVGRFFEIDADHKHRVIAEDLSGAAQECCRLVRLEIADGRTGKEAGAPAFAAMSGGSSVMAVKSTTTGQIARCGKSRCSRAASWCRKSPEISTGT